MKRRDVLKALFLATPTAQAAYMASRYGVPGLDIVGYDLIAAKDPNPQYYFLTQMISWSEAEQRYLVFSDMPAQVIKPSDNGIKNVEKYCQNQHQKNYRV